MTARVVTAFFSERSDADGALAHLLASGVPAHRISVLPKHVARRDDIGVVPVTKAPEGAVLGAVLGGALGGALGALLGGGSVIVPGLDLVLAGRAVAALAAAGAAGALGLIAGAVLGATRPEFEAKYLGDALAHGGALVAIRCDADRLEGLVEMLCARGAALVRSARAR